MRMYFVSLERSNKKCSAASQGVGRLFHVVSQDTAKLKEDVG